MSEQNLRQKHMSIVIGAWTGLLISLLVHGYLQYAGFDDVKDLNNLFFAIWGSCVLAGFLCWRRSGRAATAAYGDAPDESALLITPKDRLQHVARKAGNRKLKIEGFPTGLQRHRELPVKGSKKFGSMGTRSRTESPKTYSFASRAGRARVTKLAIAGRQHSEKSPPSRS